MKLHPIQEAVLEELRKSEDPLSVVAKWRQGTGKSIVISAYIQDLRDTLREMIDAFEDSIPSDTGRADKALDKAREVLK